MKAFLIFLIGCIFSVATFSQQSAPVSSVILTNGSTTSRELCLSGRTIPSAIWADSLTSSTTLTIQIGFSKRSTISPTEWFDVCEVSDTTVYSVPFADDKLIPFDPVVMLSVIGNWSSEDIRTFVRFIVGNAQTGDKIIKIRERYF